MVNLFNVLNCKKYIGIKSGYIKEMKTGDYRYVRDYK